MRALAAYATNLALAIALHPNPITAQTLPTEESNSSSLTILPLPRTTPLLTTPPTTNITYHQGLVSAGPGPCGGHEVSRGLLTAGSCVELATFAVGVGRMQGLECVFRLFRGSEGCRGDADGMINIPIPSGEGEVCIVSQVEDGGRFVQASGFLVCG